MKKMQRGFSLMEVLLVMVIIVALSAGGIYGWQKWQQQQRLWITVQQVRNLLQQLRSDANWKNIDHLLRLTHSDTRWCLSSRLAADTQCADASRWQLAQPFAEVELVEMTAGLGFYGIRNTAWPGHLVVRSPAGEWHIILSAWGRIRTCKASEAKKCS
ncbi:prepilin peptidase-dependent protein [Enterobacteriaceae bacterium H20N1]|uniref:Prepilin peptidase-dependent protein n=2 Tax=Dryocola boscaweniae TaxID=2925397 RepID=A0A9X2W9U8_9ENTR|nr:prepilin peptidase-dependent protein [Dryocola boscaweniae]MCT4702778.1 prepilin peptidase-dependent protein [Dryocola boscaweniae]MCT4715431.1 prepilin peptidase-dependent protein [Dryocola boscaweniae]MCT4719946.1 prepilin peptidase-dependent protein [Dryocola boscaweniae]